MLDQLLKLIKQGGGVLTPEILSHQLNTTTDMVVMMLEDLEKRGLLQEAGSLQTCKNNSCKGCAAAGNCPLSGARIWQTKEKKI